MLLSDACLTGITGEGNILGVKWIWQDLKLGPMKGQQTEGFLHLLHSVASFYLDVLGSGWSLGVELEGTIQGRT